MEVPPTEGCDPGWRGIIDPSTTNKLVVPALVHSDQFMCRREVTEEKDTPLTAKFSSTTLPMAAVPSGWYATPIASLTNFWNCTSVVTSAPGAVSVPARNGVRDGWVANLRARWAALVSM